MRSAPNPAFLSLLLCLAAGILFTHCRRAPSLSHRAFLATHPYAVGQMHFEWHDTTRNRPLRIELWYPTHDTMGTNLVDDYPFVLPATSFNAPLLPGKFPLVLLSHGTGGNRISQMWLATELAGHGNLVAAVDHYGNTLDNKIPEHFVKIWHRPLDLSFVLDQMLQHDDIGSHIDPDRLGAAGFSLGGFTTLALAGGRIDYQELRAFAGTEGGKQEFVVPELGDLRPMIQSDSIQRLSQRYRDVQDDRFRAFVAMAPSVGQGYRNPDQFANVANPVLIIGAAADTRTPVATNAYHYHQLIEGSQYLELGGDAGHYIFMNRAQTGLRRRAKQVFQDAPGIDRAQVHREVADTIRAFLKKSWHTQ